jgi:hypothetical protein
MVPREGDRAGEAGCLGVREHLRRDTHPLRADESLHTLFRYASSLRRKIT